MSDESARRYLAEHKVTSYVDQMISSLVQIQPKEADLAMAEFALGKLSGACRAALWKKYSTQLTHTDGESSVGEARAFSVIEHNKSLELDFSVAAPKPRELRSTKIICTLGPSTESVEKISKLIQKGMTVARLNFSHASHGTHAMAVKNVRKAMEVTGESVAIALDTCGPEVRLGRVPSGTLSFRPGDTFSLSVNDVYKENPSSDTIFISYANIRSIVHVGSNLYFDNGNFLVEVTEVREDSLLVTARMSYHLTDYRSVNIPGVPLDLPVISPRDEKDLQFAVEHKLDMIFVSFVQAAADIRRVRELVGDKMAVIAKIESQTGLEKLDEILEAADGIMVARGDLGADIPIRKLFLAQKTIISKCNAAGKPVIVAAQLLDSMCSVPHPSRAEANDIANAVLDGADALMLSSETAVGHYPFECVETLNAIACEAQDYVHYPALFQSMLLAGKRPLSSEEVTATSAVNSANEVGVKLIVTLTTSGNSARMLSKYFPPCPVLAVCREQHIQQFMQMVRSVVPFWYPTYAEDDRLTRIDKAIEFAKSKGIVHTGDIVVAVHGDVHSSEVHATANVARMIYVP